MSDLSKLPQASLNLRWLARKRTANPDDWSAVLASAAGLSPDRVQALMIGAQPRGAELDALAAAAGREPEELASAPLYGGGEDILRHNLHFLLDAIPAGQGAEAARSIGITASQLSRWKSGLRRPHPRNLRGLLRYHGLDPDIPLDREPLFLMMEPVGGHIQKQWLVARVEEMPNADIVQLYPALKRLLSTDEDS